MAACEMEPLIRSSAGCVAGKMRMDARRATKVVASTTKPRRTRVASHLRSCTAERASARLRGRTYPMLHASASTTQTLHFAATRRDGAIRAHGIVVRRWFGLYQTALLTTRPAPGLQTVATAWDLIRGSSILHRDRVQASPKIPGGDGAPRYPVFGDGAHLEFA